MVYRMKYPESMILRIPVGCAFVLDASVLFVATAIRSHEQDQDGSFLSHPDEEIKPGFHYSCPRNAEPMRALLSALLVFACAVNGWAQIPNKIGATPQELAAMEGRTLVVQLDPLDPKLPEMIEECHSKDEFEAFIANYTASHQSYLDNIQAAMEQAWVFNKKVEFKSPEECMELFKQKSPDHIVMKKVMYGGRSLHDNSYAWWHYTCPYGVTALTFYRTDVVGVTEKGALRFREPDFQMYMFGDYGPLGKALYSMSDLSLTMAQAQKAIAWCISREEPEDYFVYAKEQAKRNCQKVAAKDLVMESDFTFKGTQESELMEEYGPRLRFASHEELGRINGSGTESEVVCYSVPIGHVAGMGGESQIAYMKVLLDPSTGDIIGGSFPMAGGGVVRTYRTVDVKAFKKCK
jgi:hypothetical protein